MSENQKQIPGTPITENPDKTINMMGMQVDLSSKLGEELSKILSCQFTEEEMEALLTYIKSDMFTTSKSFNENEKDKVLVKQILKKSYYSDDKYEPASPIVTYVAQEFHRRYKDMIVAEVDKILASEEYVQRIEKIAQDLVDYVSEGYKEDLMNSVRARMCTLADPGMNNFAAANLKQTVQSEINDMLNAYANSIRRY
jgi:hypothetical protein